MARVLYDGLVEYEDGTAATTSQMAKDVVEFLNWSAEPEMDQRKKMGIATVVITSALLALSIWVKRFVTNLCSQRSVLLTVLTLDINGLRLKQGNSSTILPASELLSIVRLPGFRLHIWGVGVLSIREIVVLSACIYHLRLSNCVLQRFHWLVAPMMIFLSAIIMPSQSRPYCLNTFPALTI